MITIKRKPATADAIWAVSALEPNVPEFDARDEFCSSKEACPFEGIDAR
ncbi:hypothetical protein [Candidatus Nitrospira bockiana]